MPSSVSIPKPDHIPSAEELKEEVVEATKSSLQSLRALVAGGVGGVCAVVVGHPFDLVKVRLQTAEKGVYNGALDVVRKTIAREGMARVRIWRVDWERRSLIGDRGCMLVFQRRWSASRQCVSVSRCLDRAMANSKRSRGQLLGTSAFTTIDTHAQLTTPRVTTSART